MTSKADILRAVRDKCWDCSGYQRDEIRLCPVQTCALWPFRMGNDPNPARRGTERNLASVEQVPEAMFQEAPCPSQPGLEENEPSVEQVFQQGGALNHWLVCRGR